MNYLFFEILHSLALWSSLINNVKDKDYLIEKLWTEILENKNKIYLDEEKLFRTLDYEAEISEEGQVGNIHQPVGKSHLSKSNNKNISLTVLQDAEINRLKVEISESQETCKELNERLREINELYIKQEIENKELRERLKTQSENLNSLTQDLIKLKRAEDS